MLESSVVGTRLLHMGSAGSTGRYVNLALVAAAMSIGASCGFGSSPRPQLTIEQTDKDATAPFGETALLLSSEASFEVVNQGDADAVLGAVSSSRLGIKHPFQLLNQGTCKTGLVLPAETGRCTIVIQYSPLEVARDVQDLTLRYQAPDDSDAGSFHATFTLRASSHLDCSIAPDLSDGRADGVAAAEQQMVDDAIAGKADGEALTYDDGYDDGYNQGYADGYDDGFNDQSAYPAGYNDGYASGYDAGVADPTACSSGAADGYNDGQAAGSTDGYNQGHSAGYADGYFDGDGAGYSAGYANGQSDGIQQGYSDGYGDGDYDGYADGDATCYPDGYDDGYDWGYYDGSSCGTSNVRGTSKSSASSADIDRDKYVKMCFDQGYGDTYSNDAYWDAFRAARDANVDYQAGLADGIPIGKADGYGVGLVDGYNTGLSDGDSAGFADGAAVAYSDCYQANYQPGYEDGFESGYDTGYSAGYNSGYTDASNASYNTGYADGYATTYSTSYSDGYNDGYDAAWDDGCDAGYNTGYSDGYNVGFADGEYDYCYP